MAQLPAEDDPVRKKFRQRLDRAFADIDAFLLAPAIGLAMLDIACFTATRSIGAIKSLLRVTQTAPLSECVVGAGAGDTSLR